MTTRLSPATVLLRLCLVAIAALLAACATPRPPLDACAMTPAGCDGAARTVDPVDAAYRRKLLQRILRAERPPATPAPADPARPLRPDEVERLVRQKTLADATTPDAAALGLPENRFFGAVAIRRFTGQWRRARQRLALDAAAGGDGAFAEPFIIDAVEAISHDVALAHPPGASALSAFKADRRALAVTATCDGPFEVRSGVGARRSNGRRLNVTVPYSARLAGAVRLAFADKTTSCRLAYGFVDEKARRTVRLKRRAPDSILARIDRRYDVCVLPRTDSLSPIERFFFRDVELTTSCVEKVGAVETLPDARAAFQSKVAALLGRPLPDAMIDAEDPFAPIDFSAAPKLDAILVSSLVIKNDFSGQVFARLLAHHARAGTPVRILVARASLLRKDRKLVEKLAAANPNIELDEWRWKAPAGSSIKDLLSQLHKVHHVKMLVTLGARPADNVTIIGGRNIHDGFLFKEPPDLSRWKELNQYSKGYGGLNPFVFFNDLDVRVRGRGFAEAMAVHYSTLFNRDAESFATRPPALMTKSRRHIGRDSLAGRTLVRHFTSVPYADDKSLEAYFVGMIDAADRTIDISSPYLNLTPDIEAAFARALDRGVRIRLVTRIDLRGDIAGAILSQVNKGVINAFWDRIEIYESTADEKILHSKIVLIDGRFAVVGSVNLNKRSFIHDTENGFAVLGHDFAARIDRLLAEYRQRATRVTGPRRIPPLLHLFISIPLVDELF
ncbi:MAG: phosphatidylserine/phosphatidylglycerophosphate/cardiolipin synthase family protein [Hyphomicrobiales bacterium]